MVSDPASIIPLSQRILLLLIRLLILFLKTKLLDLILKQELELGILFPIVLKLSPGLDPLHLLQELDFSAYLTAVLSSFLTLTGQ